MRGLVRLFAASALAGAALSSPARAEDAAEPRETTVDGVVVTGGRTTSAAATGLELSLRETPQSVTVVGREQIHDFALTSANALLDQVTGINVERVETDRTYYDARGFPITNFQVDGVGLPLAFDIQYGDIDTVIYERVEAVRGADGLLTGIGNPSAAINFVRKRPSAEAQGYVSVQYGSWDDRRAEADVSGPITSSGAVRGRLVYAGEDAGSYLDHYGVNRNVYYGALAFDLTPRLTFTTGYSRQDNRARGVLWGALPLDYSNGARVDYPVSASTAADWTRWDVLDQNAFGELAYGLANGWTLKGVVTYGAQDEDAKLLYAFGNPDPVTGLGVGASSGLYPSRRRQYLVDVYASGPLELFGRRHQLAIGLDASRREDRQRQGAAASAPVYPAVGLWGVEQPAQPAYLPAQLEADQSDRLYRAYAAAHLDLTDRLKAVVGVSAVKLTSSGYSYGVQTPRDEHAVSPYAGVVLDLTTKVSAYASYTDIFNPQSEVDASRHTLPAAHGRSYEAGLKSQWLENRLYLTAAVFRSSQSGLAEAAGTFADTLQTYYRDLDTFVTGLEVEAAGRLTERWTLNGGFTALKIEGDDGQSVRPYIPRRTLKLATTYAVPELRNLRLGAAVRWQSDISTQDLVRIEQQAYAVLDLMAAIDLTPKVRATLNIKNAADDRHLTSLMWSQAYYAAPRSASLRLDYAF